MLTHSQFHYPKLSHSFPRKNDLQTTMNKLRDKYHPNTVDVDRGLTAPVNINLEPTGLCYRRFFVLTAVPGSIWHRLISRCLTDSKFIEIVKKNCCSTLPFQPMQNLGKTIVGNSVLEWKYWKNGVELRLSEVTLLQISSIDLTNCNKQTIPLHAKINNMYIHNGDEWLQITSAFTGGLEIVAPEHILMSVGDSFVSKMSEHVSPQIFTHAIEVIDEIFMEWFSCTNTGNGIQAISEYLISFTPCPICVGDKKTQASQADALTFSRIHTLHSTHSVQVPKDFQSTTQYSSASTHSSAKKSKKSTFGDCNQPEIIVQANKFVFDDFNSAKQTIGENLVGFTIAHCLWVAQDHDLITCPNHGDLELQHLTPDLVSRPYHMC